MSTSKDTPVSAARLTHRIFVACESVLLLCALVEAVRWCMAPEGQHEQTIVLVMVLVAILEYVKQRFRPQSE